jgi:hypothetical protein
MASNLESNTWSLSINYGRFLHIKLNENISPQELSLITKTTHEGKCTFSLRVETSADMCISRGLLFMWSVVPSFRLAISVAASPKISISALRKWKTRFSWEKTENGLRGVPRRPKGHAVV